MVRHIACVDAIALVDQISPSYINWGSHNRIYYAKMAVARSISPQRRWYPGDRNCVIYEANDISHSVGRWWLTTTAKLIQESKEIESSRFFTRSLVASMPLSSLLKLHRSQPVLWRIAFCAKHPTTVCV